MGSALLLLLAPAAAHAGDLAGQWHLDEGATNGADYVSVTPDSSGNGITAYLRYMTDVPGRFNRAFTTEGSASDVFVQDAAKLPLLEPAKVTALAWVKSPGPPPDYGNVMAKGADTECTAASWALYTGNPGARGLQFYVNANTITSSPIAPASIWDDQWHMVAGTYDGSAVRLYVDGKQIGSGTPLSGPIKYEQDVRNFDIGNFPGHYSCTGDGHFQGSIDEARVYNRALNGSELAALAAHTGPDPPMLTKPVARFLKTAPSLKMKGALRFSALGSTPGLSARIVDFHWTVKGPSLGGIAKPLDTHCGAPTMMMSHAFKKPGTYKVTLTVTDTRGAKATTFQILSVAASEAMPKLTTDDVFDCENPAKGNQPDRADCVKNFSFGIVDVNSRDRDECFNLTARIDPAVFTLHRPGGAQVLSKIARLYHATVKGDVAINGIFLPLKKITTEYDSGDRTIGIAGLSTLPVRIGPFTGHIPLASDPFKLEYSKDVPLASIKVEPDKKKHRFHVFDFDEAFATPKFLGSLKTRGALSVDLLDHASETKVGIGLPPIFKFMGDKPALADAFLISDNQNGIRLDGISAQVPTVNVGPLTVENLLFKYRKSTNTWAGGAKVKLPGSPIALDAAPPPPDWGFGLKNGRFDHAGFGVEFQPGFRPDLFPPFHTALLSYIGASLGVKPLRLTGKLGLSVAEVVDETGVLFAAFASPDNTYEFPGDVGDQLAPFAGRTLDAFTLAVGGTASLHVPILGYELPLLNAYGMYQYPDYFELGGGFKFDKVPWIDIHGDVKGFVYPSHKLFDIEGGVQACLKGVSIKIKFAFIKYERKINPCIGVGGVVSSTGIGFCGVAVVPIGPGIPIPIGLGYKWGDALPSPKIFSCNYDDYKVASPKAARAAAAGYSVKLPKGLPSAMFRVRGRTGAPDVTITDPHGHDATDAKDTVFIQWGDPKTVFVALRHPIAGRWKITPKSGSPAIASFASAHGVPKLGVKAKVTGHGRRRVLHYRLTAALAGRKVVFAERGPRTNHVLGTAHGKKGDITFKPATGRGGERVIVALVSQNGGAPARALRVASYKAPKPQRLSRPGGLRVKRKKRKITVSWHRVSGAVRYQVLLLLSDRSEVFRVTRSSKIRFADPFQYRSGKVLVAAVGADGSRSPLATKPIKKRKLKKRR